jgi:hypothetical protein
VRFRFRRLLDDIEFSTFNEGSSRQLEKAVMLTAWTEDSNLFSTHPGLATVRAKRPRLEPLGRFVFRLCRLGIVGKHLFGDCAPAKTPMDCSVLYAPAPGAPTVVVKLPASANEVGRGADLDFEIAVVAVLQRPSPPRACRPGPGLVRSRQNPIYRHPCRCSRGDRKRSRPALRVLAVDSVICCETAPAAPPQEP